MTDGDLSAALTEARSLVARLERLVAPRTGGETLTAWSRRWFQHRRSRNVERERKMYRRTIRPMLGRTRVAALTRAQIRKWVATQDDAVAEGTIRWATAQRRWILLRAMLRDLTRSKRRELRVREDDVASGVRGPDRGADRAATFLTPAEAMQLLRSRRVPLADRRRYALSIYLAVRAGELAALTWGDVDLRAGTVHVYRSVDAETGALGPTKTGEARRYAIEPTLLPLLRAMRGRPEERIVDWPRRNEAAAVLREHLRDAGCTRAELFAADDQRRPITHHDLRATGITWWAMRGDPIAEIMARAGHRQMLTTQRYVRLGQMVGRRERVFPPIPTALLR